MGIADQQALDFYLTPEHECSYLPGRTAQTLFAVSPDTINRFVIGEHSEVVLNQPSGIGEIDAAKHAAVGAAKVIATVVDELSCQ